MSPVVRPGGLLSALAGLALALGGTCARAEVPPGRHVKASLVAETDAVRPGQTLTVGIRLDMERGWHTYWRNPGDSGLPTRAKWELPGGFAAGEIRWPYPIRFTTGPLVSFGYEHEVLLPVEIRVPAALARDRGPDRGKGGLAGVPGGLPAGARRRVAHAARPREGRPRLPGGPLRRGAAPSAEEGPALALLRVFRGGPPDPRRAPSPGDGVARGLLLPGSAAAPGPRAAADPHARGRRPTASRSRATRTVRRRTASPACWSPAPESVPWPSKWTYPSSPGPPGLR